MAAHYDARRVPPAARMTEESAWPPREPLRMAPPAAARRTREALDRIDKFCSDAFEGALAAMPQMMQKSASSFCDDGRNGSGAIHAGTVL